MNASEEVVVMKNTFQITFIIYYCFISAENASTNAKPSSSGEPTLPRQLCTNVQYRLHFSLWEKMPHFSSYLRKRADLGTIRHIVKKWS